MKNRRVVIIGAGHVGSHCAMAIAGRALCDEIVLIDIDDSKSAAQAADIADSMSFYPQLISVRSGDYGDCDNADIIIASFGRSRFVGESRSDMLSASLVMADDVISKLKATAFNGIIISITNPCDVIAAYIREKLEYERWRCFGTGTLLDSARLIRILSEETGCPVSKIHAYSMGEHGNTSMIAFSDIRIGDFKLDKFDVSKGSILRKTRAVGNEIIESKGSTEFGIGIAAAVLVKAIFDDEKKLFPVSVSLCGEYGQHDVQCGVPCIIGKNGIEKIMEIPLNEEEATMFALSCEAVREGMRTAFQ